MKFLHSGDFHISSSFEHSSLPRKLTVERRNDIWKSVENLIKEVKIRKVEMLFLCGDLYNEEYVTLTELKRLNDLFNQIPETNVFIIFGNHDPYKENSKWKLINIPSNVYIFKNDYLSKFEFEEYDVYGISFIDNILNNKNIFDDIVINKNKKNFILLHTDIVNSNFRYLPIDLNKLKNIGYDYIALAHLHKPMILGENIVYPGSIEPLSFNEQGIHGAAYGEFYRNNLTIELIDLSQSIFIEKDFKIEGDFNFYKLKDELINNYIYKDKKNYLRINLVGYIPEEFEIDINAIHEQLKDEVTYLEIVNKLDFNLDLNKLKKMNKNNVVGIFIDNMSKKDLTNPVNKSALKLGLKALLKENR